jgi:pyridoxal phosphate enzyme (YggS family)
MEADITANINKIKQRIAAAAARCNRASDSIKLLAVTKTVPLPAIEQAIEAGITAMGENYVQEAKEKIAVIGQRVSWHMIGHLQTNKAKYTVNLFDYIHSVDRLELAAEINKRARLIGHKINILIEINISGEKTKNGITTLEAIELIKNVSMLRNLRNKIISEGITNIQMEELSMGMTDDFEIAIEEGATIVRIGRAIFGQRK